jgi:exopolyphosphatase / guanosine-5'-triphosphate,3'-diphosphate pyrophosphatase
MQKPIAVIDLGTNTFHLVITQVGESQKYHIIHNEKVFVQMGDKGISKDTIHPEAADRVLAALHLFRAVLDKFSVPNNRVLAVATSAFRSAKNGQKLLDQISEETKIEVRLIGGQEEAGLILEGVRSALHIGQTNALVMDIGGGSVEFIIANDKDVFCKESFDIGAQRLLDAFMKHDPILQDDIQNLNSHLSLKLKALANALEKYPVQQLIGSSGTFDTIVDIHYKKLHLELNQDSKEFSVPIESYQSIHEELISKDKNSRAQIEGMSTQRVEMIVVASCLLDFVVKLTKVDKLRVSAYALKEGLLKKITEENE